MAPRNKMKTAGSNLPVPQDDSEARETIREIGDLNRDALRIEAEMNDRIAALQQEYGAMVAPIRETALAKQEGLKMFCEVNRDRLTKGGKVKYARFAMGWDLLAVMHPPCTRLCNSGVRWLHGPPKGRTLEEMWADLDAGAALFSVCWNADIPRVAVENPVMHKHAKARIENFQPAAQTVQPWWFGDPAFKATGLYLRGLAPLRATNKLTPPKRGTEEHKKWSKIHRASPGSDRWKLRSATFPGIADAMADQWGSHDAEEHAA